MSDEFPTQYFNSDEEMMQFLREHSDSIESVVIPVQNGIHLIGPRGEQRFAKHAGAMLRMCDGTSRLIHREHAEELINDGILQRMKIKCVLFPLTADPPSSPEGEQGDIAGQDD